MALPYEYSLFPCTPEAKAAGHCQQSTKSPGFSEEVKKEFVKLYYPNAELAPSTPVQQAASSSVGVGTTGVTSSTSVSASTSPSASVSVSGTTSSYYVYKTQETSSNPVPMAKNLFGANLDVVTALDRVEFEPYGDGSMRNAIAHIVPWKRGGVSNKTQSLPSYESVFRDGALNDIASSFGATGIDLGDLGLNFDTSIFSTESLINWDNAPSWNEDNSVWESTDLDLGIDYAVFDQKGKTNTTELTNAKEKQKKLGSEIPVGVRQGLLTGLQFANSLIPYGNSQIGNYVETGLNLIGDALDTPSGPIYIGNPAGIINQGLNLGTMFGFNIPGRGLTTSIAPDLQSNESKGSVLKDKDGGSPGLPEGIWQFLFNPSELSLNVGPNYKETDTWGVMGDANGGKPLHFTNLKNPELKFSKVLLNGYVFGRQVENLEQGLFDLFMKNPSGNSPHGPQVLEFVWGKKTFGPCVIKDIQISEKMWDDGLLVNAEVSFTLVKVPEWTINDGQVSVYDPSSLDSVIGVGTTSPGTVGTGTTVGAGTTSTTATTQEETAQPPSSNNSSGLSAEEQALYRKCQDAQKYAEEFGKVQEKIRPTGNIFSGNFTTSKNDLRNAVRTYTSLYNKMAGIYGRDFTGKITNPTANSSQLSKQVEAVLGQYPNLPANRQTAELTQAATYVYSAADSGRVAMKAISNSAGCKAVRDKADKITAEGNKARAEQKRCDALRAGSSCSPIGSVSYTCGGTKILCDRDGRWKNYNAV